MRNQSPHTADQGLVDVRPAAVAGSFYPSDPVVLRREVEEYLHAAAVVEGASVVGDGSVGVCDAESVPAGCWNAEAPQALVLPHAGYQFSGAVAGLGYALERNDTALGDDGRFRRVVVIGPAHRVPVRGVATAGARAFATPLGHARVDLELLEELQRRLARSFPDLLVKAPEVHAEEHSVEVHLPFIQVLAPNVSVLPLVAGDASTEELGALVSAVLADTDTLLVISSDLSHYLSEDQAHAVDAATLAQIHALAAPLPPPSACGRVPIDGLLDHARRHGLSATVIGYATSADTPGGDANRVVGYPAVRCDPVGPLLPALARAALDHRLAGGPPPADIPALEPLRDHPWAAANGASFVTLLRADGTLRGCIGALSAYQKLWDDVADHAVAAALSDPRFPPVQPDELAELRIEVSVLSAPEPIDPALTVTEDDAVAHIRPGIDGLILAASEAPGARRGTFLPSVWEQLPKPTDFLRHLKAKAGLPDNGWCRDYRLWRYTTTAWQERPWQGNGEAT